MRISNLVLAAVASLFITSCLSPQSTECASGLVCPVGSHCSADQNVCITDNCGDGVVEAGEVCDDGNVTSGDGCSADCKSLETCGNGYVDTAIGEVCDDGNNTSGDGCSADCKSKETCGNGIVDPAAGEICDDGNNTSGDGCSADCKSNETCGNHHTDTAVGEVCDDGNNISGDGCSADCKSTETCGNGILDTAVGEKCDDGNNRDCDGCSANCKSNEKCGNGFLDNVVCRGAVLEICDDGNTLDGDGCSANCLSEEHCGNGVIDVGEQCDDGVANVPTDSLFCTNFCKQSFCGDGYTNLAAHETCDTSGESATCNADCTAALCGDGKVNSHTVPPEECDSSGVDTAACNKNCTRAFCGDGYTNLAAGEACDDMGQSSTCNANCTVLACGDGIVNATAGEQCDVAPGNDTVTCNGKTAPALLRCKVSRCGDGYHNAAIGSGEACDTGGDSPTCNANCTLARCGDGIVNTQTVPPEVCDDGNTNTRDACLNNCQKARCGDHVVWIGHEVCDDGDNVTGANGCSGDCRINTKCGDGTTDSNIGEVCDDGNNVSGDGCSADCLSNETCGNGYVDVAKGEKCDDGNAIDDGNGCSADCKTNTHCGNGILEPNLGEACDDGNKVSGDGCSADCLSTEVCGNGYVDVVRGETCDDGNNDNTDGCPSTCLIAFCGDGFVQKNVEDCDDHNTDNTDGCLNTCKTASCGDGFIHAGFEACDDHNKTSNDGCSSGCALEPGFICNTPSGPQGPTVCTFFCGDGIVVLGETCDDHNALACGSCSANCQVSQPPAAATGHITAVGGSALRDGETFTISDGVTGVTFEYDVAVDNKGTGSGVAPGHVAVAVKGTGAPGGADSTAQVVSKTITAINGVAGFAVTAAVSGPGIGLTNDVSGSAGNVAMTENVLNAGFIVTGMSNGAGADCITGNGCNANSDCASGHCDLVPVTGTHTCIASACGDGTKNGTETGVDCGGSCSACPAGQGCLVAGDCQSLVCTGSICQAPTCGDVVQNQGESDIDCGGTTACARCGTGKSCTKNSDCASAVCDVGGTNLCLTVFTLTATQPSNGKLTAPAGLGAGINCGATCSDSYVGGTVVTLTAVPNAGFQVASWGGDCAAAGTATTCQVTMSQARTASVTYSQIVFALTATQPSNGKITAPAGVGTGINCGATCSDSYATGTVVTLTAVPNAGFQVASWGGDCASAGTATTCQVTMSQARTASVTYSQIFFSLTATQPTNGKLTAPAGAGGGINCGATCTDSYASGTVVTVTAVPNAGFQVASWGGDCASAGTATTCQVTMSQARTASVTFSALPNFSVTILNIGQDGGATNGSVVSDVAPIISCGVTCSQSYVSGTVLKLTATADPGHSFLSWSGGPCALSTNPVCQFTLSGNVVTQPNFN